MGKIDVGVLGTLSLFFPDSPYAWTPGVGERIGISQMTIHLQVAIMLDPKWHLGHEIGHCLRGLESVVFKIGGSRSTKLWKPDPPKKGIFWDSSPFHTGSIDIIIYIYSYVISPLYPICWGIKSQISSVCRWGLQCKSIAAAARSMLVVTWPGHMNLVLRYR